jgi:hypothetical protein
MAGKEDRPRQLLKAWLGDYETQDELYHAYVRGCRILGRRAHLFEDFWLRYTQGMRAYRFLKRFESWQSRFPGRKSRTERRQRLRQKVEAEWRRLRWIYMAIAAGMDDERSTGGAGVAVRPLPQPPCLTGSAARPLPHLDLEPAFRDP